MKREYYSIYKSLLNDFESSGDYPFYSGLQRRWFFERYRVMDLISRTLDVLETNLDRRLRPDGRLFLLMNFVEMVAAPVLIRASMAGEGQIPGLMEKVTADLTTILNASESENGEISGHSVLEAITRSWQSLKLMELDIWG